MTKKNKYQTHIAEYKKRRKKLKGEYQARLRKLTYKIKMWNRQLRRMEVIEGQIDHLGKKVREFTGQKVKNSYPSINRKLVVARRLFFKYGLENGLRATDLAQYTGCRASYNPSRCRRAFNREMERSPETRELWQKFRTFMKDDE